MSQNMLPFESRELWRYGPSWTGLRLRLIRSGQAATFRRADGVIFLTHYAARTIRSLVRFAASAAIIPHGVQDAFRQRPRLDPEPDAYGPTRPFRCLYVSIIDAYKHQPVVALAASRLRQAGIPIAVDFVGPPVEPWARRLRRTLRSLDSEGRFLRYLGAIDHRRLPDVYAGADAFVFASSCENLPNILLEAMASSLPIACSSRGPMPEVLRDAGVYFDPENVDSLTRALEALFKDPALRARLAADASRLAAGYTWARCADSTFAFVAEVFRHVRPGFRGSASSPPEGPLGELSDERRPSERGTDRQWSCGDCSIQMFG
jgi:glycosyltransferase involved in cell wall biosynthesis